MKGYFSLILLVITINIFAFSGDEKLTFGIRYGFIKAGTATLNLSEKTYQDTIEVLEISSLASTNGFFDKIFKVRDRITSIWDNNRRITLQFTKNLREGSYRQKRVHYYYPEINLSYYIKYKPGTNKKIDEKKMKIPDNTQDILSAFYEIRSRNLQVGKDEFVNVVADGRNYRAKVVVHKIETLDTIFGKKKCFVIEPILSGEAIFKQTGKIRIWITADNAKVPVKLQSKIVFGSFYAELEKAKNVSFK